MHYLPAKCDFTVNFFYRYIIKTTVIDKMLLHFILCILVTLGSTYADITCNINIPGKSTNQELDCSSLNLTEIPSLPVRNIGSLSLQNNSITSVPPGSWRNINMTLKILDLSHNLIAKFDVNSFSGLKKLEVPKIGHNHLCLHSAYPEGLFKDLVALKTLYTLGNKCPNGHFEYPDQTFRDLHSLKRLSLDTALIFIFRPGFGNLSKLESLEATGHNYSQQIYIKDNSFLAFHNLPITQLTLRGLTYYGMETGSLKPFTKLETVNFACASNIDLNFIITAITNMPKATLKTIVLDGIAYGDQGINLKYNRGSDKCYHLTLCKLKFM